MNRSFRTEVSISHSDWDIGYHTPVLFIGSCFSDHIGGRMKRLKFPVLLNPFGVLYNPSSIARAIEMIIGNEQEHNANLVNYNHLYCPLNFHGSFSRTTREETLEACNQSIENAHTFLRQARFLILTFGTSWVYRLQSTGNVVANCHKLPDNLFLRERLTTEQITGRWIPLLNALLRFNPDLKVLFTISPVRHLKDGAHGNQLSKSGLFLSIDHIIKAHDSELADYFPAYELIHDELRDYRFYGEDMIHISETGIKFVFKKFADTFFNKQTQKCRKEVDGIVQSYEHRLLGRNSQAVYGFGSGMLKKIRSMQETYPFLNFQEETDHFKRMVAVD